MLLSLSPGSNEWEALVGDKYFVTPISNSTVINQAALLKVAGVQRGRASVRLRLFSRGIFPLRDTHDGVTFWRVNGKVEQTGQWQQTQITCRPNSHPYILVLYWKNIWYIYIYRYKNNFVYGCRMWRKGKQGWFLLTITEWRCHSILFNCFLISYISLCSSLTRTLGWRSFTVPR